MKPDVSHKQIPTEILLPFLKELLQNGKSVNMTVTGNSMLPLFRDKMDSVLLERPGIIKKFDIVLYVKEDGQAILHRIVKRRKDGYMIVGDNQIQLDGPIAPSQIVAVVTGFYRNKHFFSCTKWWCRLYGFVWGHLRLVRRPLIPLLYSGLRLMKRIERMGK